MASCRCDRQTTTVKFRRSWSVASQAATFGCEESLLTSSTDDRVGLGERRQGKEYHRLGDRGRGRGRGDRLLGERTDFGGRRPAPEIPPGISPATSTITTRAADKPAAAARLGLEQVLPLLQPFLQRKARNQSRTS